GKGYGTMLVEHAVKDARSKGLKIVPVCPFAALKIKRRPEWQDVLDDGAR
ncbi:MAG: GNAT family N-acetyltransferase, partial [Parvularcula sp.]|nr:GNAT family N-acetyltransferase [Parvularcula sp.]